MNQIINCNSCKGKKEIYIELEPGLSIYQGECDVCQGTGKDYRYIVKLCERLERSLVKTDHS